MSSSVAAAVPSTREEPPDVVRLAELTALSPNPLLEVSADGRLTYRNAAADRLWPDLESAGVNHPLLVGLPELVSDFRAGRRETAVREVRLGTQVFEQHMSWIPAADRLCIHVVDLTTRKELERQLLQSQKLESIGQLAAGIAHEINTPLQYVGDNTQFLKDSFSGLCELIRAQQTFLAELEQQGLFPERINALKEAADTADLAYCLERIPPAIEQSQAGLKHVAKIVRALREFSHPSLAERKAIDLNRAVENTVTISRNEWKYVADLETDLGSDLPPVPCFGGELNQVVLNIIVNAAHAIGDALKGAPSSSGAKGKIRVSTRREGPWAEIRISDSGTGIPEGVRDRIFEPFFTTKEVGRGTGQGLAIAHAIIVKKHKGTLTFETELGRGTTFIIRLPLESEEGKLP